MSTIKIVTDSSVQLTPAEIETYHINVIPLTIMIDNTIYIDGETISRADFMTEMANASALPKTSQPAIGSFIDMYDKLGEDGSQIISLHMTETISGTVNTAKQAAEMSKPDVTVIDSDFTDRALGFQVIAAAKMAQEGASLPDILAKVQNIHDHTKLYMGVVNLNNLVKGGRISRVSGMLSNLLNIKVILEVTGGQLNVIQKGRGMKTIYHFVDELEQKMQSLTNIKAIGISHADARELSESIRAKLAQSFPNVPILVEATDPVIATHAGAGAFAVMYYTEDAD